MRKLLRIHVPVAEAGMLVLPLAEPAIVHHKSLNADAGSLLCERLLSGLVHVETRRLPRVVKHRPHLAMRRFGHNRVELETVQQARRSTDARVRIAAIKLRSVEGLPRR